MKALMCVLSTFMLFLTACADAAGEARQRGPFLFHLDETHAVLEVSYALTVESDAAQGVRKPKGGKGKSTPLVAKASLKTDTFSVEGRGEVSLELEFKKNAKSGTITIGGKSCAVERLYYGSGSIQGTDFEGFTGACKLDGKAIDFYVGPVRDGDPDAPPEK